MTYDSCLEILEHSLINDSGASAVIRALGQDACSHVVGGGVRDVLLQRQPKDLDIAVVLTPDEVVARLDCAEIKSVVVGAGHLTVRAIPVKNAAQIEISTFRGALDPKSRLATYSNSIEIDLAYRDFTINAIAYDINKRCLIDPNNGLNDLSAKIVRAVSDPEKRFKEDPLRILRMVRLKNNLGFSFDKPTYCAAQSLSCLLNEVSIERVRDELSLALTQENPGECLTHFLKIGALEVFMPEVAAFHKFEQNRYHRTDLFDHTMEVLNRCSPDLITRLAALLHDVGKPATLHIDNNGDRHFYKHEAVGAEITRKITQRLRYPKGVCNAVELLVRTHMRPVNAGSSGLRRLLRDIDQHFTQWRNLKIADSLSCARSKEEVEFEMHQFDQAIQTLRECEASTGLANLAIGGNDLIKIGYTQGPEIGKVLRFLSEHILDFPEDNTQERLIELARPYLSTPNLSTPTLPT